MRSWKYQDQDGVHVFTERQILKTYYAWWKRQMIRVGKRHLISPRACIEDWVVVNWAQEVK